MMKSTIGKPSESNEALYKGVRKRKWGKWVSEIRLPNSRERIWLGSYDSPEKAARSFDAALFCLRGKEAKFNFPNNIPNIPNAHSLSPSQIQAAAHRYANELQKEEGNPNNSEYESPSLSVQPEFSSMDWGFLDYTTAGSSSVSDFDVFSGVNDFPGEFLPLPEIDYDGDENESGGFFNHHHSTSLWNF